MASPTSDRGFTLFETLVATGILVTALAGIAQLFVLASQLARKTTASGVALRAAQNKLETLQGREFGYNEFGTPQTSPDLEASPADSLNEDTPPYLDWLDAEGVPRGGASGAAFVRRWRVAPLDAQAPDAVTIEVCVFAADAGDAEPSAAHACLSTLRVRQP